ncbi:MAG: cobalt-precorrin-5B (C(1))-methyltransferase CbiD, partial [Vulcanococcus sp.]
MAECGYTLPVWVAAAAVAAVRELLGQPFQAQVQLLLDPEAGLEATVIPVQAAARLGPGRALATSCCDPGEVLDLTRGLQVWVEASWTDAEGEQPWLELLAGEGVGVHAASGEACLSAYARQLLESNLRPLLPDRRGLRLTLTFPEGRQRAARTSNAAFGVVDGLALIGTQALVQRSAAPDQLDQARQELARRSQEPGWSGDLVLVLGENGLDLAPQQGLPPGLLLKAGNWIGPLLVAAAEAGVRRLLLFGYQGKLIKLAGGIFHTHHHLADGRLEILAAQAAQHGCSLEQIRLLLEAASVDQAIAALA